MDISRLSNITELRDFLKASNKSVFQIESLEDKYSFISDVVSKFNYQNLNKKDKHLVVLLVKK